jgi:hypothetical protein
MPGIDLRQAAHDLEHRHNRPELEVLRSDWLLVSNELPRSSFVRAFNTRSWCELKARKRDLVPVKKQPEEGWARDDFVAPAELNLDVHKGQRLWVYWLVRSGWSLARSHGLFGYVPTNCITFRRALYRYSILNNERKEIRLLVVEPSSSSGDRVQATVKYAYLEDKPKYETISYVWESSRKDAAIFVGGCHLDVPANAKLVLRRLRHAKRSRTIWIDAICVNQDDNDDKGHQVARMAKIYSNTRRNLAWLGEIDAASSDIPKSLDDVLENARLETAGTRTFADTIPYPNDTHHYPERGSLPISTSHRS